MPSVATRLITGVQLVATLLVKDAASRYGCAREVLPSPRPCARTSLLRVSYREFPPPKGKRRAASGKQKVPGGRARRKSTAERPARSARPERLSEASSLLVRLRYYGASNRNELDL